MNTSSPPPGAPYLVTLGDVLAVMAAGSPGPFALGTALRLGIAGAESNVAVGVSLGMTMLFFVACLVVVSWMFRTGYRLKS